MTYSVLGIDIESGQRVEIPKTSRLQGLYIIGIPGTGKSGLIENLILQDMKQGLGVGLLDPHGDLIQTILAKMPENRVNDVIYLDITDYSYPFGLNLFACSDPTNPLEVQKIVDQVMHVFEKLFDLSTSTTPRIRQYLRNCTHTLVVNPGYTMAEIPLLLLDEQCRNKLVANVINPQVRGFWKTYNAMKPAEQLDHSDSTLNKLDEFLQPLTVNIVGQSISTIDIRKIMDERKIFLLKLNAQLTSVTSLIGSVIIALFLNAAYSRSDLDVQKRKQFNLYADEFQRFATNDFATLLTEARKFGIGTTIAHQARYQPGMTDGIRATSLSASNLVVFKVNSKDADELAGEFDITPQEAWEEEIEPQKLERIEEEVIDGEEPVQTYKGDVVGHLLKQGHDDERVTQFVRTYLQPFSLGAEKNENWVVRNTNLLSTQEAMLELNNWLYEGMRGQSRLFLPLPKTVTGIPFFLATLQNGAIGGFYLFWHEKEIRIFRFGRYHVYNSTVEEMKRYAEQFRDIQKRLDEHLAKTVQTSLPHTASDFHALRMINFTDPTDQAFFQKVQTAYAIHQAKLRIKNQMVISENYLSEDSYEYHAKYDDELKHNISSSKDGFVNGYRLFEHFSEAVQLCQFALSQKPLMTIESGLYQPRKRTQVHYITVPRQTILHPQRSYQDMLNEVSSELANLPNYTSQVRIAIDDRRVEHTIRTLEPERGLIGIELQERLARIREQNIKDGYVLPRLEVEAEILLRQTHCSQQPDEPPDAIYRRQPH